MKFCARLYWEDESFSQEILRRLDLNKIESISPDLELNNAKIFFDNGTNLDVDLGRIRFYEYDNNGNITRIYNNNETLHTFTYDTTSKCKLISYDDQTITYASSSFYPSSITRNGTTIRSFTFQVGRLVSFVNNEINLTTTYRYDIDGRRILKANTTNNIAYFYNRIINCDD